MQLCLPGEPYSGIRAPGVCPFFHQVQSVLTICLRIEAVFPPVRLVCSAARALICCLRYSGSYKILVSSTRGFIKSYSFWAFLLLEFPESSGDNPLKCSNSSSSDTIVPSFTALRNSSPSATVIASAPSFALMEYRAERSFIM